jgi:hypothetical protein
LKIQEFLLKLKFKLFGFQVVDLNTHFVITHKNSVNQVHIKKELVSSHTRYFKSFSKWYSLTLRQLTIVYTPEGLELSSSKTLWTESTISIIDILVFEVVSKFLKKQKKELIVTKGQEAKIDLSFITNF